MLKVHDPYDNGVKRINLSEADQKVKNLYCIVRREEDGINMLMPYVLCRDYFNDYIVYNQTIDFNFFTHTEDVYGFYSGDCEAFYKDDDLLLAISFEKRMSFSFLRKIERDLNLEPTKVYYGRDVYNENVKLLKFDKKWLNNPTTFHGYTYLIRVIAGMSQYKVNFIDYCKLIFNEKNSYPKIDGILDYIYKNKEVSVDGTYDYLIDTISRYLATDMWLLSAKEYSNFCRHHYNWQKDKASNYYYMSLIHDSAGITNAK